MKKGVYIIFLILLIILLTTVIARANSSEKIVETLINNRTDVLSLYYAGRASREDTVAQINRITTSHLNKQDLYNIERYFQCDIEQVRDYKITNIDITYDEKNVICANVTIEWEAESLKGQDNFVHTYSVICEKEKNSYKLSQFF